MPFANEKLEEMQLSSFPSSFLFTNETNWSTKEKDTHLQKKANVKAIEKVFNVNKSVFGLNLSWLGLFGY